MPVGTGRGAQRPPGLQHDVPPASSHQERHAGSLAHTGLEARVSHLPYERPESLSPTQRDLREGAHGSESHGSPSSSAFLGLGLGGECPLGTAPPLPYRGPWDLVSAVCACACVTSTWSTVCGWAWLGTPGQWGPNRCPREVDSVGLGTRGGGRSPLALPPKLPARPPCSTSFLTTRIRT